MLDARSGTVSNHIHTGVGVRKVRIKGQSTKQNIFWQAFVPGESAHQFVCASFHFSRPGCQSSVAGPQ